jgi:hypothetical protein
MDEMIQGPDTEEDQVLVLHVQDYQIGKKLTVPSENVAAEFNVTRFGPESRGDEFKGYIVLNKVLQDKVEATMHLDVTAHTVSTKTHYTEVAKFHGNYVFVYKEGDSTP